MNNNSEKFYKALIAETNKEGMKCPINISELGANIGLNEVESKLSAVILVKKGLANFKCIGDTDIELIQFLNT